MFAHVPNESLQRTFDPPPTFAIAKAVVASTAAELQALGTMGKLRAAAEVVWSFTTSLG